jgi:hypothetical protein
MKTRWLVLIIGALAACNAPDFASPHHPNPGVSSGPVRSEIPVPKTIEVYGHTSRNGQFWSITTSNCQQLTLNHTHRDSTGQYVPVTHNLGKICATNEPSPYNGGWINVYAIHDEGEEYLTQVSANSSYITVATTSLTRNFRLQAFASGLQELSNGDHYNCSFDLFSNFPYGQSNITVSNSGTYEAYFSCVTPL